MSLISSPSSISRLLAVPGATLYAESRGSGPLLVMIPGGPADADGFALLADALSDRYQVVTYDPRGNSRSQFDAEPDDFDMNVMGNDAAVLIAAYGESAFVFGSSGGAQIALNLAARYPQLVNCLVAHEPPCVQLLPDRELLLNEMDAISRTFAEQGPKSAMMAFMRLSGMKPLPRPVAPTTENMERPPEAGPAVENVRLNLPYFFDTGAKAIAVYCPDIERLKANRVKIAVGLGATSAGELANRAALALASALSVEVVRFPGGHAGFGEAPLEFAEVLHHALNA